MVCFLFVVFGFVFRLNWMKLHCENNKNNNEDDYFKIILITIIVHVMEVMEIIVLIIGAIEPIGEIITHILIHV